MGESIIIHGPSLKIPDDMKVKALVKLEKIINSDKFFLCGFMDEVMDEGMDEVMDEGKTYNPIIFAQGTSFGKIEAFFTYLFAKDDNLRRIAGNAIRNTPRGESDEV